MIFYSSSCLSSSPFIITSVSLCFILADLPLSIDFITASIAKVPFNSPTAINTLLSIIPIGGTIKPATINIKAAIEKK